MRRRKQGFTLVELIVVMAGVSTVMGVSVVLLFMMFDFQQRYAEQSTQIKRTNRFIEQFREDARGQNTPLVNPGDDVLLQWSGGGRKITYSLVPGEFPEKKSVMRQVWRDEEIESKETYLLPDHTVLGFDIGKDENTGLIALSLWEQRPHTPAPEPAQLDPFSRALPESLRREIDPKFAGNWHTAIARISIATAHEQ
jgi:type II secretory pathway pseudopilin PulG